MKKKSVWGKVFSIYIISLILIAIFLTFTFMNGDTTSAEFAEITEYVPLPVIPIIIFVGLFLSTMQFAVPVLIMMVIVKAITMAIESNRYATKPKQDGFIINGQLVKEEPKKPDLVDVINDVQSKGTQVHVARGSEVDALYRKKTGKSLSDISCHDCDDMEPWDEPKVGLFNILKKKDSEVDDVEEYYRSRGINHGDKR